MATSDSFLVREIGLVPEIRGYNPDAACKFSEGQRLPSSGDFPAAVQSFSAAITLDPDHWTAHFRRAEAYRNLGLEELARGDLARAEFLMTAVRQVAEESGASSDGVVADTSDGALRSCVSCCASGCLGCLGAIVVYSIIILIIWAVVPIIAAILP